MLLMTDVSKTYPSGSVALRDVNIHIQPGEFVFVVGPSGAGKSTFIKMLFREVIPTTGNIYVNGVDLLELKEKEIPYLRRQLGIIFQDYRLLPDRTVYDNVAFAMQVIETPYRKIKRRVMSVLDLVGLRKRANSYPTELSGGEQQRVAIARAIVNDPLLVIADEPTGNLDPETSWDIMRIFSEINESGTTIVMATHDKEIVDNMEKRVIAIEKGSIVRDDTKEYFIRETYKSIKRNGLMSLASVSTVALSLLVLGMFLLIFINTNNLAQYLESQVQITVYMEDSVEAPGLSDMKQTLENLPGVLSVTEVSKQEALSRFKERLGQQEKLLHSLGTDNPFPNSFEVQVDRPDRINELAPQIHEMEGVETAKFGQEIVEHIFQMTKILRIGGVVLVILLALATLFIIANTIRLTVFARRKEVNIMKYVGATDWFIRWPFILEGMTLGFFGALIANFVINGTYAALLSRIYATLAFLPMVPAYPMLTYVDISIILAGTAIGAAGSYISLRKFLKV